MPDDEESDEETEESFARLVGPTRPVRKGPPRLPPPSGRGAGSERSGGPPPAGPHPGEASRGRDRFRWPDPEERCLAAAPGVNDGRLRRLAGGDPSPEEQIDLHGLRSAAAGDRIARSLGAARARGLSCVLVIHGRGRRSEGGTPVLRDRLPGWLTGPACADHVLAFAPAPPRLGGPGATLVLLRR
ncbi:MAG: Smr/MutS family protein [bacterium]